MNRAVVPSTIVLLAAAAVVSTAFADGVDKRGATPRPTVSNERLFEIPPIGRETPVFSTLYCTSDDCASDSDRRCENRGHGEASDQAFHVAPSGAGHCLITCSDGYLLLIVEEHCTATQGRPGPIRRQRAVWMAPGDEPCADPHDLTSTEAVCATVDRAPGPTND